MERQRDQEEPVTLSPQIVTMITAEHYTLQSAQAQEVSDINGQTSLFIGTVSGALIALALVGLISRLGMAFYVFSLVLFPSLVFMGIVTFERVIQSTYAAITYARGISRIRRLYLECAPELRPYFILPPHDDTDSVVRGVGIRVTWWQFFLITPAMVVVVTSVLVGSFADLLLAAFNLPLWSCASAGVVAFLISLGLLQLRHWGQFQRIERRIPALFPNERYRKEVADGLAHQTRRDTTSTRP